MLINPIKLSSTSGSIEFPKLQQMLTLNYEHKNVRLIVCNYESDLAIKRHTHTKSTHRVLTFNTITIRSWMFDFYLALLARQKIE